jgi:hypothetical protein
MNRTIEVISVNKNGVLTVAQILLSAMAKPLCANNGSNVCSAIEHLFGKQNTIISYAPNTGSSFGLLRIARSDYYANCLVTVPPNCMASRIIGLNKPLRNTLIILSSGI